MSQTGRRRPILPDQTENNQTRRGRWPRQPRSTIAATIPPRQMLGLSLAARVGGPVDAAPDRVRC